MKYLATVAVLFFVPFAGAEEVRIVLWNGEELFDVPAVNARQSDLEDFANDLVPDILLLDEVCSLEAVARVRDIMGLSDYHVVCSDYSQNDNNRHGSFEVAVLSRFPITHCVEFDVTPDNRPHFRGGEPAERLLDPSPLFKLGLARAEPGRGFLWVRIDQLKLTICLTHLKSSATGVETENAQKREFVAASMALSVLEDKKLLPGWSYMVTGDLNVGATDVTKNGIDLLENAIADEPGDRYDDTHAILRNGLVEGLTMKNLTIAVGETYDDPQFAGSGPIDNLYVDGDVSGFADATKESETYGSDHFPVWTILNR